MPSDRTGKDERCPWGELESSSDSWRNGIAGVGVFILNAVPFADNNNHALTCLVDNTGKTLVKLCVQFVNIHEKEADISFFDSL
ncbi:hypothetical protein D9M68_964580 [compost metagenome]